MRFVKESGVTLSEGGGLLRLSAGTLRGWMRRERRGTLGPTPRGRPRYPCSPGLREVIRELAWEVGPEVSVEYVRERLWWVPRKVVEEVVRSWKRERERDRLEGMQVLIWRSPGCAWSCDWTEPDVPLEGGYREVLVARDLGSKWNLGSLPATGRSAALAARVMEHLFLVHGAPLVAKTDGGPEFQAGEFRLALARHGVTQLTSPGYYPRYNGAIEAGIGSLKTHAWYEAAREGRLGYWTCDDLEAGRLKANETSRPWGPGGPSPDMLWAGRSRISAAERADFLGGLAENRVRYGRLLNGSVVEQALGERLAIRRTLEERGYLVITRRRLSLGVSD